MTNAYRAGQWRAWDDLAKHVASGELRESHTLEFKRDDYGGGEGAKKELARDIAQLAIDGGVLIIGIEEDKPSGAATDLKPIELPGVVERYDQICESRIRPPLRVTIRDDLRDPSDPARGVLLIEVPGTDIPHMVDHQYFGRDNRRKRRLDHTEVVRLLARRDLDLDAVTADLDAAGAIMDREGMTPDRLVITATPIPLLRGDALREMLAGASSWMNSVMRQAAERAANERTTHEPLGRLTRPWHWADHCSGWGVRRIPGGAALKFGHAATPPFIIEVLENGAVRFAYDSIAEMSKDPSSGAEVKVVYLTDAVSFACEALAWTAVVAEAAGLRGAYGFGVHLSGLGGAVCAPSNSVSRTRRFVADKLRYRDDNYRQVFMATGAELAGPLPPLVDKMFGALLRAFDLGDPLRHVANPSDGPR